MNQIIPAPPQSSGAALTPRDMSGALALANTMCTAKLVPPHLQKSPGDCLLVIEQAMRWGMSPFAVAQCTSVIHGRLMFQGQLVSAALHTSGILASRLTYEFDGSGDNRTVRCIGTLRGESVPRDIVIRFGDAKTDNAMWKKQPDQQLVYFATRAWARRHAPEVMLGVYSPEEFNTSSAPLVDDFQGTTIDASPTMGEQIGDSLPEHSAPPEPQQMSDDEAVAKLIQLLDGAGSKERVDAIMAFPAAIRLKSRIALSADAAYARVQPPEPTQTDALEWPTINEEAAE